VRYFCGFSFSLRGTGNREWIPLTDQIRPIHIRLFAELPSSLLSSYSMFPLQSVFPLFSVVCNPLIANAQRTTPPPSEGVISTPPAGCDCNGTSQYNPVCGTDNNTYSSLQILQCHQICGFRKLSFFSIEIKLITNKKSKLLRRAGLKTDGAQPS